MAQDFSRIDSKGMNKINMSKVLRLIREKEIISIGEITRQTDLTAPSVFRLVKQLMENEGLVKLSGVGPSKGGRPPVIYEFNGSEKFIIGIDVGATYIRAVLANLKAEILYEVQLLTEKEKGYNSVITKLTDLIRRLLSRQDTNSGNIIGIGIGVAGLIDKNKKRINFSPDFKWENVDFHGDLAKEFNIPVYLDNSTRLMALGELGYGIGKKCDNFIVINVGYGIAAGIVVNGETISGSFGHSGEFGHMTINPASDIVCDCGRKGCIEALSSGRRIAEMGQERVLECAILNDLCKGDIEKIDAKMVAEATRLGDKVAGEILDTAICNLSIGIRNLVNLLDPEKLLIGGGVSLSGSIFFDRLIRCMESNLMQTKADIPIQPVTFLENATIMGALTLVLDKVLNFELNN
jgi:predicted NBD/HSP70 family sugar kinase